jgi:hypothetical protein
MFSRMNSITLYTFEDSDGNEFGSFTTQNYGEAKDYAGKGKLRVIANEFTFEDSSLIADFTDKPAPGFENSPE